MYPQGGRTTILSKWIRARSHRIGGSVPLSSAAVPNTQSRSLFPVLVKRLGCFDARPPCVMRPGGVLAPHWSARNRAPPPSLLLHHRPLRLLRLLQRDFGGRGLISFCEQGRDREKKNEFAKIVRGNVEISSSQLLNFTRCLQKHFSYFSRAPIDGSQPHHSPNCLVDINLFGGNNTQTR